MQLFVGRNGQQLGPFEEVQVRRLLNEGTFAEDDLAWRPGLANWLPLAEMLRRETDDPIDEPPPLQPATIALARRMAGGRVAALASSTDLASRGARLGAKLIDGLLLIAAILPGALAEGDSSEGFQTLGPWITALLLVTLFIIQALGISYRGQTVGKRLTGARIVRTSGKPAGFVNGVVLRRVVSGLLSLVPGLGIVYVIVDICFIFGEEKRCLHDLIADTRVVRA